MRCDGYDWLQDGNTAFLWAVEHDKKAVVKVFIESGAFVLLLADKTNSRKASLLKTNLLKLVDELPSKEAQANIIRTIYKVF